MVNKVRIIISSSHNPFFNLATEDWIFRDLSPDTRLLFLWRNQPTVVIGRFQNPWRECNLLKMNEDNVYLARRQSGGGAVFQDLGNTNFTFMSGRDLYRKEDNNQILINALKKLQIDAFASGRNDLMLKLSDEARKISGSAFKENRDRCFHHGTMLINVNLERLANYLNPSKKKLEAKGITSVRSRVANLAQVNPDINHDTLVDSLILEFKNYYQSDTDVEFITLNEHETNDEFAPLYRYYHHLKSDQWRIGETPEFTHELEERFSFGEFQFLFHVVKGSIEKCTIYSDTLHPEMVELMGQYFKGKKYTSQSVSQVFHELKKDFPHFVSEILQLEDWVLSEINEDFQ